MQLSLFLKTHWQGIKFIFRPWVKIDRKYLIDGAETRCSSVEAIAVLWRASTPGRTDKRTRIMAEITFACPHCSQTVSCDDAYAGQELQCPLCHQNFIAPGQPPSAKHNPLAPKPPSSPTPRLNLGGTPGPQPSGQRTIPIRDLAGPKPKRKSPLPGILAGVAILAILGAGGYFGYDWYAKRKAAAEEAERIANTPPPPPPPDSNALAAAAAAARPILRPSWTLEVAGVKIEDTPVNGQISGSNFVHQTARIDPSPTAQVLRFLTGQLVAPDLEILIYLHLKPGERLGGQTLTISPDMRGAAVPQVTKRWKNNPRFAPLAKPFVNGYAMKLELGQVADGAVPGKIFLALPDPEKTVIAGTFKATLPVVVVDPNAQPGEVVNPTPATPVNPDIQRAMQQRYGTRP